MFWVTACTESTNNTSTAPKNTPAPSENTQPIEPVVIDDIFCNTSSVIQIKSINEEANTLNLPSLFDGKKTNDSTWQASTLDEELIIEFGEPALVKQLVITWKESEYIHLYQLYASKDKETWTLLDTSGETTKNSLIPDLITLPDNNDTTALYLKLSLAGNEISSPSEILEIEVFGCKQDVNHQIELIDWYLSIPSDTDNNGKSDSIKENELAEGYFDPRFFNISNDSGLTFTTSVSGYKTSTNTKYVRSELREMLRRGNDEHKTQGVNENNWVFSSAPTTDINNAGGVDGNLTAELSVNHVTSTGEDYQIGRVIIGQIHANDDEPARLYYRKLPNNINGSIYLAHELLNGDDEYYEIIGSRDNSANNPSNGIPLNEKFTYSINVEGNELTVTINKADGSNHVQTVDMSQSGYDIGGQYMYFKAGVYNQNNSGDPHDYVKATFYKIENSHNGY